jgi:SpoVK/Ycf46/Vps4 family AAA+-type ATPase
MDVEFPLPDYPSRKAWWDASLNGNIVVSEGVETAELANKFRFSGGQIRDAVAKARNLALWQTEDGTVSMETLYAACRAQSNQKLSSLAQKIQPKYTWDDIILPNDRKTQLREMCHYLKYRPLVYGEWGFERKLSLGKGLNALFHGPSGTGKTMAAEIMASELEIDLYKIDLSQVVSKYIGETEKNLDKIFTEAETSNAILFFDEADALFGKRSEVKDAHDRYANIEIGYLLQKMEEYEGMTILATNLRKNMDEAFVRRLRFSVEFPFPDRDDRCRIWEITFPPEAPREADIDFDYLAKQFKITGGNIKNIVLCAAFLAAEDGGAIAMKHIIHAVKREFQKMGKLCMEEDFGKYYSLLTSG